jgi:hypothetical protein
MIILDDFVPATLQQAEQQSDDPENLAAEG